MTHATPIDQDYEQYIFVLNSSEGVCRHPQKTNNLSPTLDTGANAIITA
jgi:hypothetical protein